MNPLDFLLLALDALGGSVRGRTMMQKKVYFLGLLTGELESLGYRPHYYGPYSPTVADAVTQLKVLGFIREETKSAGVSDNSGFEVARQDYSLSDDGRAVVERAKRREAEMVRKLQEAARRLGAAGEVSYVQLSIAAKINYILKARGTRLTPEAIREAARDLGWPLDPDEVRQAVEYLSKLDLVSFEGVDEPIPRVEESP